MTYGTAAIDCSLYHLLSITIRPTIFLYCTCSGHV